MSVDIYSIQLKSHDGQDGFLKQYRGKVCLIVNVTADCGNAPQYGIIEDLYQKYKDQGFEVIAVPTNDYCGPGITYGKWEQGIKDAEEARNYAKSVYGVTYNFSELVKSKPSSIWKHKTKPDHTAHELYDHLTSGKYPEDMSGNFEKFILNKNGDVIARFSNASLMDYSLRNMIKNVPPLGGVSHPKLPPSAKESYDAICAVIEKALAE